jgi:hypothetical protein
LMKRYGIDAEGLAKCLKKAREAKG